MSDQPTPAAELTTLHDRVGTLLECDTAPRVQAVLLHGKKYWLKKTQARGILLGLRKGGAKHLLETERTAIHVMANRGLPVAPIVLEGENYFVSGDVGIPVDQALAERAPDANAQQALVERVSVAVADLHRANAAHGGLHLRNICLQGTQVSFIDLEKACPKNASLKARSYDLRVLLFSVFAAFPGRADLASTLLDTYRYALPAQQEFRMAQSWARDHKWLIKATFPLRWHEAHFRPDRTYRQYSALPEAIEMLSRNS